MEYNEIKPLVIEWAKKKNLTDSGKQYLKIFEEVGELAKAILEDNLAEIKDAIGDIAVTLIIHGWQTGIDHESLIYDIALQDSSTEKLFNDLIDDINIGEDVTLSSLNEIAHKYDTDIDECLTIAWNTIKNRKGKTVNGTFIKDNKCTFIEKSEIQKTIKENPNYFDLGVIIRHLYQ